MKQYLLYLAITGIITTANAQSSPDQIIGRWQNEKKLLTIEFYNNGGIYSARIAGISSGQQETITDKNNPDPAKRNQPLVGSDIITGLCYKSGKWSGGKLYAPKRGIYLDCEVSIKNDRLYITAKKGLFSETKIWDRKL